MLTVGLGIAVLALIGGFLVLLRRPARARESDDRDVAMLEEAEREVRDLGAMTSPDASDEALHDRGPGAPQ